MRTLGEHQDAVRRLLDPILRLPPETIPATPAAAGRVLAAAVTAPIDLPPFDNSQMDGYALRAADSAAVLRVVAPVPAGHPPPPLEPGTAAPVMTGAPIPEGADAVVEIEAATPDRFPASGVEAEVALPATETGRYIRRVGSDVRAGESLLGAGTVLGAAQLGLLAASGVTEVAVRRRPRVLVISTGDELAVPGTALEPAKVYDANGTSLAVAIEEAGAEVVAVLVVADDARALAAAVESAPEADLVVTSGGVSHGAFEVVRDTWEGGGVEFVQLALQPAGPQGLGAIRVRGRAVPVLAFPGNPVSVLLSFELLLRPVVRAAAGLTPARPARRAALAEGLDAPGTKHQVRRGTLDAGGRVRVIGGPGSHLLRSYATATHLIHIPVGTSRLEAGEEVELWDITAAGSAGGPTGGVGVSGGFSHLDDAGEARMVDVGDKEVTARRATASARLRTTREVVAAVAAGGLPKGDAVSTARIAGIMAAKRTWELVPLCHQLPLSHVDVRIVPDGEAIAITAEAATTAGTGVEMEALTAASVAAVTMYDMIKAVDPRAEIERLRVESKSGGRSGDWTRDA